MRKGRCRRGAAKTTRTRGTNSHGHPEGGRGSRTAMQAVPPSSLPAGAVRLPARFARLRFIDREGTARKLLALEPGNGAFRRGAVGHLDEAKAFGAASVAISNDPDLVHSAIGLKELAKVMVR